MNVALIELLLWGCLLLFFWTMKDRLNDIESNLKANELTRRSPSSHRARPVRPCRPQSAMEPIGWYRGEQIYQYAVIGGRRYQFDRVWVNEAADTISDNECCVEPGLVYRECGAQEEPNANS